MDSKGDMPTLQNVLEAFRAPLNEEQAWAVCYQSARYLETEWNSNASECCRFNGVQSVQMGKDGVVHSVVGTSDGSPCKVDAETELVASLGVVVFQALDFGLSETEEQKLSAPLEQLIARMTGTGAEDEAEAPEDRDDRDEGIEDDTATSPAVKCTLQDVIQACEVHLPGGQEASSHYKAVCRALINESEELVTFLETISSERTKLKGDGREEADGPEVDDLERADWARLWIQIMRQLRHGVQLKKVEHAGGHSVEFELTPYEILMEDIRSRRYTLNKVMVNGDIPQKTKKDAHEIILEFIRSRPPLHPAKDRKLSSPPVRLTDAREELMEAIRAEHKLRPTPGRIVETSRTRLDDGDAPAPARKVIKPDLSLLMSNSFDDDEDDGSDTEDELEDRNRVLASPLSPLTPLETPTNAPPHPHPGDSWQQKARLVCFTLRNLHTSLECLSLTIEEVMHIRSVLTKAELECLVIDPTLQALIAKGKVCFTCKRTKFSLFGAWATRCKFCRRNVCSRCSSKMRIPTEHFEHIPVYTLSPSPMSPNSKAQIFALEKPGSAPNSPETQKKLGPFNRSPPDLVNNNKKGDAANDAASDAGSDASDPATTTRWRPALQRADTVVASSESRSLQGPIMNICRDCKAMIVNIIRASRLSLAKAPDVAKEPIPDIPSRRPSRNFHLDLKPVYKQKSKTKHSIF